MRENHETITGIYIIKQTDKSKFEAHVWAGRTSDV